MELYETISKKVASFQKDIYNTIVSQIWEKTPDGDPKLSRGVIFLEDEFFNSFWEPSNYETFFKRYNKNRDIIKKICRDIVAELANEVTESSKGINSKFKVFIESGSTTAGLGPAWVNYLGSNKEIGTKVEFLTNNLFVLNALVGPSHSVAVTPGPLLEKYLAFIPFSDKEYIFEDEKDKREIAAEDQKKIIAKMVEELQEYNELLRLLSTCDKIYMATSEFGFLAGPFVGSRSNAIFKHAVLCNKGCKNIQIVIPGSKLFIWEDKDQLPGGTDELDIEGDWCKFSSSLRKASTPLSSSGRCFPIMDIEPLRTKIKTSKPNAELKFKSPEAKVLEFDEARDFYAPAYSMLAPMKTHTLDHMRIDLPIDWVDVLRKNPKLSVVIGIKKKNISILEALIKSANEDLSILQEDDFEEYGYRKIKYLFENKDKVNNSAKDDEIFVARITLTWENVGKKQNGKSNRK